MRSLTKELILDLDQSQLNTTGIMSRLSAQQQWTGNTIHVLTDGPAIELSPSMYDDRGQIDIGLLLAERNILWVGMNSRRYSLTWENKNGMLLLRESNPANVNIPCLGTGRITNALKLHLTSPNYLDGTALTDADNISYTLEGNAGTTVYTPTTERLADIKKLKAYVVMISPVTEYPDVTGDLVLESTSVVPGTMFKDLYLFDCATLGY